MTKTQKIWMWVFLAIFLIPEVLWSPIINVLTSFFGNGKNNPQIFRKNFLTLYANENLLKIVITVQLIAILLFLFKIIKNKKNIGLSLFWFFLIFGVLFCVCTLFAFYLLIIFDPSF